jgi:hypothetical protein
MSMMRCAWCSNFIDTDYDSEGWFEDVSPFRYKCASCLEDDNQGVNSSGDMVQFDEDGNEVGAA